MKVLLLTDDQWDRLRKGSPWDEVKTRGNGPKLPGARELVAMGRNGGEPEAFTLAREQLEAIEQAQGQIRERLHGLIHDADAVGVKPGALARWSGYTSRRVHQIAREGE